MSNNNKKAKIRLSISDHLTHPWEVHDFLSDFEIEDVWRFPIELQEEHSLSEFREQMSNGMKNVMQHGIAGWLFQFRLFLGKVFGWDSKEKVLKEKVGSLRERYVKKKNISFDQLLPLKGEKFEPVFETQNEYLSEIENATVHAALHLGKIATGNGSYDVQMAIYVKPKGLFGRTYMKLIQIPRHMIVYPAIMRFVGKQWQSYLNQNKELGISSGS